MAANKVLAIPMSTKASAGVISGFTAINAAGLPQACFLLKVVNNSSMDVTVSYDGSTAQDYVPHGQSLIVNGQTNSQPSSWMANFAKGTVVYVSGTAGTGNIYLVGYYIPVN